MADIESILMGLQNGNDVRGAAIATDKEKLNLTPAAAQFISEAFIGFLAARLGKEPGELRVGVGHDSRLTAEALKAGVIRGMSRAQVFDCGLVSTPAMFQSTVLDGSNFDGSVMITASHLPFNRNGLKFFTKDGGLEHDELTAVLKSAVAIAKQAGASVDDTAITGEYPAAGDAKTQTFDLVSLYSEHMREIIKDSVRADDYEHPLKGLHIVEDAGNGAAGFFAKDILEPLGADTTGSVFLDPDGTFPNHIPNPENKQAMDAARRATVENHADLGVIFDCDGDRGAVVFADGTEVNRNTLIALLAVIVSEQHPHSTIVTDSVTSDELAEFLEKHGLKHYRYMRGYKNVIDKGIELNREGEDCELAIETSGHGAFKENYFSDDGAYISVKIICKMAQLKKEGKRIESLIADLGQPAEAREIRFSIEGDDYRAYGENVLKEFRTFAKEQPLFHIVEPNYEGVRVSFHDSEVKGWALLRMSLHDPQMPMNLEAEAKGGTDIIWKRMKPFFGRFPRLTR